MRRIQTLAEFRQLVVTYFNHSQPNDLSAQQRIEDDDARAARRKINILLERVRNTILAANVTTFFDWRMPMGRGSQVVDLVMNIFNLGQMNIPPNYVTDYLERAIGVYDADRQSAIIRTLNPFWWAMRGLLWLAGIPFRILNSAGIDTSNIEGGFIGTLVKAAIVMVTGLAATLTALSLLGLLDAVKVMLGLEQ